MHKKFTLVVSTFEFHATYSGTKYLLDGLFSRGVRFEVFQRLYGGPAAWYLSLPYRVHLFNANLGRSKVFRFFAELHESLYIIFKGLFAHSVLLIDSHFWPQIALLKRIRPSLTITHFSQELQTPEEYSFIRGAYYRKKYSRLADLSVDVDSKRAAYSKKYFGLRNDPLVLWNTVPSALVSYPARDSLFDLAEVRPVRGVPIVLYAGACGKEKPFSRVVNAVKALDGNCFFIAFCSVKGEMLEAAKRYAEQNLKPGSYVVHGGVARDKILAAAAMADVGIVDYAFKYEPTMNQRYCAPTKFFEYLAAGLAVVSSANENLAEIIGENGVGCAATDDDDESLGRALVEVCRDQGLLTKMKKRARELFLRQFAYETCNEPIVDLISTFLNK